MRSTRHHRELDYPVAPRRASPKGHPPRGQKKPPAESGTLPPYPLSCEEGAIVDERATPRPGRRSPHGRHVMNRPVPGPLIVASNVRKSFRHMGRTLLVLRGVDLEIHEGEIIGIVGPSGAGKSTLLHCMGTLDVPTSGSIRLAGEEVTQLNGSRLAELRNRTVGFVFQFHHLLPEFNALENVAMPGLVRGMSRREIEPRAQALLEEVGLRDRTLHRPGELSGGEQQRVALARAIVLEPKLLLADEPTGNLDSATSAQIHELFFAINKQRGTTIVVVTHNAALAASMPRVVALRDGSVEKDERQNGSAWHPAVPLTSEQ
jgi:lipoprotein-releasing system ATP-binding protein